MEGTQPVGSREALRRLISLRGEPAAAYAPSLADRIALGGGVLLILAPVIFGFTEAAVAKWACWGVGAALCAAAGLLTLGRVQAGRLALFATALAAAALPYLLGLQYHDTAKLLLWAAAATAFGCAVPDRRAR